MNGKTALKIPKRKKWSYSDYHLLPEEFRCEIIGGMISEPEGPSYSHQSHSGSLEFELRKFVKDNSLCKQ
ncbi:MAG: hypothetical protein HYY40_07755 [Bacteroidetes bacterium]|nr:hypothetical protein [Bacteroidota bacterium]